MLAILSRVRGHTHHGKKLNRLLMEAFALTIEDEILTTGPAELELSCEWHNSNAKTVCSGKNSRIRL